MADIVIGAQYVVGPDPTYSHGASCRVAREGMIVTARREPDHARDVRIRTSDGRVGWVHVDHLTPHVEPVKTVNGYVPTDTPHQPSQCPAHDLDSVVDWIKRLDGQASVFAAQRDSALQEARDARDRITQSERMLQEERDAALAEVESLRADLVLERASVLRWSAYVGTLQAEVERLRAARDDAYAELRRVEAAAPQLPDVGPVTRGSSGFLRLDGANWDDDTADEYRHLAACYLALASYKDAEAAAPDNDDEDVERDLLVTLTKPIYSATTRNAARRALADLDSERARSAEGGVTA